MSKGIYCAECGTELLLIHKAIPAEQRTITLLAPHTCPEEHPDFPFKDNSGNITPKPPEKTSGDLSSAFDKFKFVEKINDLPKASHLTNTGDKRPADQLRPADSKTFAPPGIVNAIKTGKG